MTNQYDQKLSDRYNEKYSSAHPHQLMAYSTWLEEVGGVQGKRVLDLACGAGGSSIMLSERGAFVVGIDISEAMVNEAKKIQSSYIEYIVADAAVPKKYKEESFDIVTAAFLLHYASSKEVLNGMLQNAALNLKSGGKFVAINMSPDHPVVSPGINISHSTTWVGTPFKDGAEMEVILWTKDNEEVCKLKEYYWSKDTYEECLKHTGFTAIEWVEVRMHEEGKKLENWQELEKNNMLVILKANKI